VNTDLTKIRNIAIIAHVDHGKTTLVDAFMKQSNLFRSNQNEMSQEMILDSGDLEREKGITITAKNISVRYGEYKINIIDTPGHADFGGEVERTLNMADGCILLVDAQEGAKPQTKFVLQQAFRLGLKPILVINKIDKKFADPKRILEKVNNLFLDLATEDYQLDFPVFYAIGREGKVFKELPEGDLTAPDSVPGNMIPLMDAIVEYIPAPKIDTESPFQMLITSLEHDAHLGRYLIGKINRGTVKVDQSLVVATPEGEGDEKVSKVINRGRVKKILVREGLGFVEVPSASSGEIIALAGIDSTDIGATLCDVSKPDALPKIKISNPTVRIKFEANTSPLTGKEGKFVTAKLLQQRLERELETNISLTITKGDDGSYYVAGRGELQLSILIETLRREGYEFQIRKPEVVLKEEDGVKMEPVEELVIDTNEEFSSVVASALNSRRAELQNIETENGEVHYTYKILTRNLLGLRNILLTATKGNVVMNNFMAGYVPFDTKLPLPFRRGALISTDQGTAMAYTLNVVQWRGELFIEPGTEVYEGMVVGINKYEQDLEINVVREKHKSAVRVNQHQKTSVILNPITPVTLDFALLFIASDEILEITPKNLRLRKIYLKEHERKWAKRDKLTGFAKQMMGEK
jgi:GTP-binding protein